MVTLVSQEECKRDRVRQELTWSQRVQEEAQHSARSSNFQLNLLRPTPPADQIKFSHNRIELVTDKEHKFSPVHWMQSTSMDEDSYEARAIRRLEKRPAEKLDLPVTSAHDVGWFLDNPLTAEEIVEQSRSGGGSLTARVRRPQSAPMAGQRRASGQGKP